jgi:hypothetical protein
MSLVLGFRHPVGGSPLPACEPHVLRTLVDVYCHFAEEVKEAAPAAEQPKAEEKPAAAADGGDQLKEQHRERSRSRSRHAN